jgi:peptide/nickel transport system substrate-binding protein
VNARGHRAFARRAFLAGTLAALSGCGAATHMRSTGHRNRATRPGHLRYTDGEGVSGLNIHLVPETSVGFLADLAGAYLIRYDARNRPYAELAEVIPSRENGGISADGKTITFRMRPGLRWSDGAPLTAADVVFSTHVVLDPSNNDIFRSTLAALSDVDRRGATEVVFRLREPYAAFTDSFFSSDTMCLLPRHLFSGTSGLSNEKPIGHGPFMIERWKRDEAVEFVANPRYFRGRPMLDRITYAIVTDWNTIVNQLRSGDLDFAALMPADAYLQARQIPGFHGVAGPGGAFTQLSFNLTHPPLDDLVVRRALRLATNRRLLAAKVGRGLADLQESPLGAQSPHSDPHLAFTEYDPRRAAELLESAGYVRAADGVRAKGSLRLAFDLVTPTGSPATDQRAAIIQSDWKKIGVALTIRRYTRTMLYNSYAGNGILERGKFDIEQSHEGYGIFGDLSLIFGCRSFPPGANTSHYCSPAYERANAAFTTTYDAGAMQRAADAYQARLAADIPMIVLSIERDLYVLSDDFTGFAPRGTLDGSERWRI